MADSERLLLIALAENDVPLAKSALIDNRCRPVKTFTRPWLISQLIAVLVDMDLLQK